MQFRATARVSPRVERGRRRADVLGMAMRVRATLVRWHRDDRGQDLIEYALLAALMGVTGLFAYQLIGSNMNTVYRGWDSSIQDQWQTPAPVDAGS